MKPENRHFLDELHEEAWERRDWSRLEVDFLCDLAGETKASQFESIFSTNHPVEGGFAGGSQSHLRGVE